MTVEEIARICHEVNRGLCIGLGDNTQLPWDDAPDWQRESAWNGVRAIIDGRVRSPADSHESWFGEKVNTGWRYGPVKDAIAKTHPQLVPFPALPPEQRLKDTLFFAVVEALK
jgi:hypothetical protein